MKTNRLIIAAACLACIVTLSMLSATAVAQGTAINTSGAVSDPSAMLDVSSTSQGVLVPRMTQAQKNAIPAPATGLLVYQTDTPAGFWYYNGTSWVQAIGPQGAQGATGATGPTGPTGTGGGSIGCTTANYVVKSNGSGGVCTAAPIFDNGSVGIGNVTPVSLFNVGANAATTNPANHPPFQVAAGGNTGINTDPSASQWLYIYRTATERHGIYVYDPALQAGTGLTPASARAGVAAYDASAGGYEYGVGAWSNLASQHSAALLGSKSDGVTYTKLASRSETYPGSGSMADYSAEMKGDLYNQEMNWAQGSTDYAVTWTTLRTFTILTHGTGVANSAVLLNAYASAGSVDGVDGNSYLAIRLTRDGVALNCMASTSLGQYYVDYLGTDVYVGTDGTVSLTWVDEPAAGSHIYALQYAVGSTLAISAWYGSALNATEIKR